jgi:hypothetical protein
VVKTSSPSATLPRGGSGGNTAAPTRLPQPHSASPPLEHAARKLTSVQGRRWGPPLLSAWLASPRVAPFMAARSSLWVAGGQFRRAHARIRRVHGQIWCAPMEDVPGELHGGLAGSTAVARLLGSPLHLPLVVVGGVCRRSTRAPRMATRRSFFVWSPHACAALCARDASGQPCRSRLAAAGAGHAAACWHAGVAGLALGLRPSATQIRPGKPRGRDRHRLGEAAPCWPPWRCASAERRSRRRGTPRRGQGSGDDGVAARGLAELVAAGGWGGGGCVALFPCAQPEGVTADAALQLLRRPTHRCPSGRACAWCQAWFLKR